MSSLPTFKQLPTIKGTRLVLRHLAADDAQALLSIFGDYAVTQYMGIAQLKDLSDAMALLADIHENLQSHSLYQWGIEDIRQPRVIGTCTLSNLDWTHQRAEIGFALAQSHWGQGLIREAIPLLIDYAFKSLHLHRLEADVDPRNQRSLQTLLKLGFQKEGYLRQRHFINDEYQDSVVLSLLATD